MLYGAQTNGAESRFSNRKLGLIKVECDFMSVRASGLSDLTWVSSEWVFGVPSFPLKK